MPGATPATSDPTPRTPTPTDTPGGSSESQTQRRVLWDRKVDGGFPETKELKRRVRDVIEPGRNLGHVDRDYGRKKDPEGVVGGGEEKGPKAEEGGKAEEEGTKGGGKGEVCNMGEKCEDCQ